MNPNGPAPSTKSSARSGGGPKKSAVPELLLAVKWDEENGPDPTGWWVSEKLDGVRVFWDPKADGGKGAMLSRLGNAFMAPREMLDSAFSSLHRSV